MLPRIIPITSKVLSAVVLISQLFGCGGGGSDSDNGSLSVSPEAIISGSVGDGPIVGATLNIYDKNGNLIQTEMSDNTASYSARIKAAGNAYPLTIEVINGTDLVTGMAPDFKLVSIVTHPSKKRVNINPFTTLIVESARSMAGGLNDENIASATAIIVNQLNFGLDPSLIAAPIGTAVNDDNIANVVKSSEALGEMIRRSRDNLASIGLANDADDVVLAIAHDLSDGIMDGLGGDRANSRVAAIATLVSAQVLIESLSNNLKVGGLIATDALDNSILTVQPTVAGGALTGDVLINQEMLEQARTTMAAARALSPATELNTISGILDLIQTGSLPSEVEAVLPGDSSQDLDQVIELAASVTDEQLATVNDAMRFGQEPGTGEPIDSEPTNNEPTNNEPTNNEPTNNEPINNTNSAPVISGNASSSVNAGDLYSFQPSSSDLDGDTLSFSITNRPSWASFNNSNGRLSGTPDTADAGTYSNIIISVSDGSETVSLPAFSITVSATTPMPGSVTLEWNAPVIRTDGNALNMAEISGYKLYYGTTQDNYPNSVDINDAYTTSATVSGLPAGTYYFVVTARDITDLESDYSSVATRHVQ